MLSTAAHPPRLQSLVLSLRPAQWTKNLIVFAGLLFGGHELQLRHISQAAAVVIGAAALSAAFVLDVEFGLVSAAYVGLLAIYSGTLKHFVILDVMTPLSIYGIFRYLYLVHQREGGGSPAEMLLNDRPLLLCVALWAAAVVLIIHGPY